jgi:hypothetical protein
MSGGVPESMPGTVLPDYLDGAWVNACTHSRALAPAPDFDCRVGATLPQRGTI